VGVAVVTGAVEVVAITGDAPSSDVERATRRWARAEDRALHRERVRGWLCGAAPVTGEVFSALPRPADRDSEVSGDG